MNRSVTDVNDMNRIGVDVCRWAIVVYQVIDHASQFVDLDSVMLIPFILACRSFYFISFFILKIPKMELNTFKSN